MRRSIVLLSLLCLFPGATAGAQYRQAPTQYTVVNVGGGQTQHFYRDGDKVLVDLTMPTSTNQPVAIHMRTIVDARRRRKLSWDLLNPAVPCNGTSTGDWGDPFNLWQQMALEDSIPPKKTGHETVNGMPATTYAKTMPQGTLEFWRDDTYGLLVKAVMTPKGRDPVEMFETKEFKVGAPDAPVFAVPSRCNWKKPNLP